MLYLRQLTLDFQRQQKGLNLSWEAEGIMKSGFCHFVTLMVFPFLLLSRIPRPWSLSFVERSFAAQDAYKVPRAR